MNMINQNPFLRYWGMGYRRLVPIIPPGVPVSERSTLHRALNTKADPRGKAVGIRGHNGDWFGFDWLPYEADEEDIQRWHRMGAGIGIKTGAGLVAVDADTKNDAHARIIRDLAEQHFGRTPVRVGNYPKALYLIRTSEPYRYTRVEFGPRDDKGRLLDRVEILSDGRQFVAHGIHPNTKQPYHWPRELVAFDDLSVFTAAQIDAFMTDLRQALPSASEIVREGATTDINQDALKGDLETIRKAVQATPNTTDNFPTREAYRDYGYAIKAALPDAPNEAFSIYADWCEQWSGPDGEHNDPETVRSDWNRMKAPYRRGSSYLYELAERHSEGKFTAASAWFEPLPDEDDNPFAAAPGQATTRRKFTFLDFDEAADTALAQSNKPLIKGLIDQGTTSVIYGDSNVGKTFVTMDLAFHIATGMSYAGLRTTQGLVVYVAAEGGNGARRRVAALKAKYGDKCRGALFKLVPAPVDFRRADADLVPFIEDIRAMDQAPVLIVIDTLSRAMAGGDENSSVDMGAMVKHFDTIRTATGAHLAIVHHTGKNKANGARGHSLLRAAVDTEIEVEEGNVSVTKQRDLDKAWASAFALKVETLGYDAEGDPVTSCTVELMARDKAAAAAKAAAMSVPPTVIEERVLAALEDIIDGSSVGGKGVTVEQLAAGSGHNLDGMNAGTLRTHLRNLSEKGHVVRPKRGFWALKAVENASTAPHVTNVSRKETVENGSETVETIFD